jgi:hypothetical protein
MKPPMLTITRSFALSKNISQHRSVIEPSPEEDEDECCDEGDNESFHEFEI